MNMKTLRHITSITLHQSYLQWPKHKTDIPLYTAYHTELETKNS